MHLVASEVEITRVLVQHRLVSISCVHVEISQDPFAINVNCTLAQSLRPGVKTGGDTTNMRGMLL